MIELDTRPARRRVVRCVAMTVAGGVTFGAAALVAPAAHARADLFNGIQSPRITTASGAKKIVHMGVLGYGSVDAIAVDTGVPSPNSISTKGSELVRSPRLSYGVYRWIDTSTPYLAAAVSWYLRKNAPDSHLGDTRKAMAAIKAKDHVHYTRIMDGLASISSKANKWGGPYSVSPKVTMNESGGTVDQIGVKTRSGAWYGNKKITVTLIGPAEFEDGSVTKVGTTKGHPLSWAWVRTGEGQVSAKVTASGLSPIQYRIYYPKAKGQQRLVVPGPLTTVSKTVSQPVPMRPPSPPRVPWSSKPSHEPSSDSPHSSTPTPSSSAPMSPSATASPAADESFVASPGFGVPRESRWPVLDLMSRASDHPVRHG